MLALGLRRANASRRLRLPPIDVRRETWKNSEFSPYTGSGTWKNSELSSLCRLRDSVKLHVLPLYVDSGTKKSKAPNEARGESLITALPHLRKIPVWFRNLDRFAKNYTRDRKYMKHNLYFLASSKSFLPLHCVKFQIIHHLPTKLLSLSLFLFLPPPHHTFFRFFFNRFFYVLVINDITGIFQSSAAPFLVTILAFHYEIISLLGQFPCGYFSQLFIRHA